MSKFEFSLEYQWDLIAYTLNDRYGYKVLNLINHDNFTLVEQSLIFFGIEILYKKYGKIPKNPNILKDQIIDITHSSEYVNLLTKSEKKDIINKITELYDEVVKDGDIIYGKCKRFASYLEMKNILENFNLTNFNDYEPFYKKVAKAIEITKDAVDQMGTFLIEDIKQRQFQRQDLRTIIPTPFRQINKITNAGGYSKGSIIVFLDRPKNKKTTAMINVALGYVRMRKKVFIADFENGEDELAMRAEQSITKLNKTQLISGEYDKNTQKILRKYKRIGGEVYIKRFPSNSTMDDIANEMDLVYSKTGMRFNVILFEYLALMKAKSGAIDDVKRISDIYLEASDLAFKYDIDHIYTTHHVVREAKKREFTRYIDNDIAKCIDIVRHAQAIYGLNSNDGERENGVLRLELVVQRDGVQNGRALFQLNPETQKMTEFTKLQRAEYDKAFQSNPTNKEEDL